MYRPSVYSNRESYLESAKNRLSRERRTREGLSSISALMPLGSNSNNQTTSMTSPSTNLTSLPLNSDMAFGMQGIKRNRATGIIKNPILGKHASLDNISPSRESFQKRFAYQDRENGAGSQRFYAEIKTIPAEKFKSSPIHRD